MSASPADTAAPHGVDRSAAASSPEPSSAERLFGWTAAALAAGLVASLYYMLDRSWAFLQEGPPEPLTMTASARIDYFWRIGLSAFIGITAGMLWQRALSGRERQGLEWLLRALLPVTIVCSILAAVFP
jgi:hypothetical protein